MPDANESGLLTFFPCTLPERTRTFCAFHLVHDGRYDMALSFWPRPRISGVLTKDLVIHTDIHIDHPLYKSGMYSVMHWGLLIAAIVCNLIVCQRWYISVILQDSLPICSLFHCRYANKLLIFIQLQKKKWSPFSKTCCLLFILLILTIIAIRLSTIFRLILRSFSKCPLCLDLGRQFVACGAAGKTAHTNVARLMISAYRLFPSHLRFFVCLRKLKFLIKWSFTLPALMR